MPPSLAVETFLDTCGQLGDDAAMQREIESSTLRFNRVGTSSDARYEATRAAIQFRPDDYCTMSVAVATREDRDEVVQRLSERMNLEQARGQPLHNPAYVRFSWQLPPVDGRDRFLNVESYEPERSPHRPVSVSFSISLVRTD